ncbi:FAD binding domain-containing protein [Planctomyces sp. SH-PL62]|uniref:FAD binding domain-containing protein n=1 Tax=Planctomyces sp. SH-PL62 TaxID=1636152 RepID=UPI00078B3962|nr:FAD binding domain-containing protein [Planctomyces sp. SH-PL62]AMV38799.1 4-hydroxybenzoyl-CoA reductase subunit beta [Planctomyces sp. SH-PL62]
MKAFDYSSPATPEAAVEDLAGPGTVEALSGGTDLIGRMKDYVSSPDRVVYLKGVGALGGIAEKSGGLEIGAGARLVDLASNPIVQERYPALRQATLEVGTLQIRNMATVGGNLLQRPRCWYFRNGFGLLGVKDGKSLVRDGENRYSAIFMTEGDALFVNPSSLAVPLIALGAQATILGADGARTIPVEKLYRAPKSNDERELTLAPGELLTRITIPAGAGKNGFYEVRQKQAHDWPLVATAVNLKMDGGSVGDCRVVLYGVAPIPWRSEAAERAIRGQAVTRQTAETVAAAAAEGAKPLSMNGYKVALVRTTVKRALLAAIGDRYWEEG